MRSRQIMFFATIADIQGTLQLMETTFSVYYFETGLFDSKNMIQLDSIFSIANLGTTGVGDWNNDKQLIILQKSHSLVVRDIPQRAGGIKYAVDLLANPESAMIQLGGIYQDGILLAGKFGIVAENDFSKKLFRLFSSTVKKEFKRVGSFYVGEEALKKLNAGWRLVTNDRSPKEYDLALN